MPFLVLYCKIKTSFSGNNSHQATNNSSNGKASTDPSESSCESGKYGFLIKSFMMYLSHISVIFKSKEIKLLSTVVIKIHTQLILMGIVSFIGKNFLELKLSKKTEVTKSIIF